VNTIRVCILALVAITTTTPAKPQQQKPAAQPTQAQLQQQIEELKKRLDDAELKAKSTDLDKDYIIRVQKQYEAYYEKVLSTQTTTVTIAGILITVLLALAARVGFNTFERLTQSAIREATSQVRSEFATATAQLRTDTAVALGTEVESLKEANATNMQALSDKLTTQMNTLDEQVEARTSYFLALDAASAMAEPHTTEASIAMTRTAIETYKQHKGQAPFSPKMGDLAIRQLLYFLKSRRPQDFPDAVRNELRSNYALFQGLDAEMTEAFLRHQALLPVFQEWREGKLKPSSTLDKIIGLTPPSTQP
jgi:hypothetical protein